MTTDDTVAEPDPSDRRICAHCGLDIAMVEASASSPELWIHFMGGTHCSAAKALLASGEGRQYRGHRG